MALGLAAARMLKASSGDRYRRETGTASSGNGHQRNGMAELPSTGSPATPPIG